MTSGMKRQVIVPENVTNQEPTAKGLLEFEHQTCFKSGVLAMLAEVTIILTMRFCNVTTGFPYTSDFMEPQ
ncbi:hypothetical protein TNCV_331641 [Trichonephila clavipes]|nr:hypothetical protein TNCV_331641 [Trichonephila clavipes]